MTSITTDVLTGPHYFFCLKSIRDTLATNVRRKNVNSKHYFRSRFARENYELRKNSSSGGASAESRKRFDVDIYHILKSMTIINVSTRLICIFNLNLDDEILLFLISIQ